jgi:DNA repair exonuclease SbcCD ATPase subunit
MNKSVNTPKKRDLSHDQDSNTTNNKRQRTDTARNATNHAEEQYTDDDYRLKYETLLRSHNVLFETIKTHKTQTENTNNALTEQINKLQEENKDLRQKLSSATTVEIESEVLTLKKKIAHMELQKCDANVEAQESERNYLIIERKYATSKQIIEKLKQDNQEIQRSLEQSAVQLKEAQDALTEKEKSEEEEREIRSFLGLASGITTVKRIGMENPSDHFEETCYICQLEANDKLFEFAIGPGDTEEELQYRYLYFGPNGSRENQHKKLPKIYRTDFDFPLTSLRDFLTEIHKVLQQASE